MKLKKLLSVFVSLALLLSLISVPVFADGNNVAQIGETEYATLTAAISAAQSGDTIKMIGDATATSTVSLYKDLTLDLNGQTLTMNVTSGMTGAFYLNGHSLTIQDTSAGQAGVIDITSSSGNGAYGFYLSGSGSNLLLESGNVVATNAAAGSNWWNAKGIQAVSVCSGTTFTMTGGSLTASNVNNNGKAAYAVYVDGGTANITGGSVIVDDHDTYGWSDDHLVYKSSGAVNVTGGKFKSSKQLDFDGLVSKLPAGYTLADADADGFRAVVAPVAQIGDTTYTTLEAAITAANAGDTITLLSDATVNTGSSTGRYPISKSLTIDGGNHTIAINGRGFGVGMNATSDIDVTFKDVTITNSTKAGRCVDTRGHINSLTLDNVVLATTGTGLTQPLTIGGNQSTVAEINIVNSTIKTSEDGSKGYAIITFNPIDMTITDSTIKGWACVYAKGPDGSAGSDGSVFTVNNSTLVSKNVYSGTTNAFSMFMFEDDNVTVNVTDSILNVSATGDQYQSIGSIQPNSGLTDVEVNLGEGNVVTMTGEMTAFATNYPCVNITGGTYNVDPTYFVAEDYVAIDNNDGTWTVKNAYVAQIGETKYATLEDAVEAAQDGATVELLADISIDATLTIDKNLTINGNNNTITAVKGTGAYAIEVVDGAAAAPIAVSINDLTLNTTGFQVGILPNADYGIDLTLTNVDINTDGAAVYANGYSVAKIIDCDLTRSGKYAAGKDAVYYSVLNVGYGGQIEMTNGTVTANGGNGVGTFPSGGSVTLTNVDVTVEDNDDFTANHALWARNEDQTSYPEYCRDSVIVVKSGNVSGDFFITDKYPTGHSKNMYEVVISITGGTFDNVPTAYVATGYEAVDNNNGTWTVGKVKVGELTQTEANEGFDATYTVTKQVVDSDDGVIDEDAASRTVNVKLVDTIVSDDKAIASENNSIDNIKVEEVLGEAVADTSATDNINVEIQVVRDKPDLDTTNNTITYEVHPEAVVYVNGVETKTVAISNDALADNADITITLPVPDALAALAVNGKIRVIHISEGYDDEVLFHTVQGESGNYYIQFNVSHFSEFELGSPLFTGHSISLNGYVDLNFYLNVTDDQVTTGTGTVVDFTWDRGAASYQIETTDYVAGKGYKATVRVPAAEMSYMINAKVTINGVLQTETSTNSVREYALAVLANADPTNDAKLISLVKTMLDYGAKAQVAFGRTDVVLANAGVDYTMPDVARGDLLSAIDTAIYAANGRYADNMLTVASNIGANGYYSSSLIYLSGCTLRHYFVGPGLDASKYTGVKSGYYYYVDVTDIAAANLDTLQAFHVGDVTFYYSALDFVKAIVYNYDSGSNYDLAAATYWYNQAANAYFE